MDQSVSSKAPAKQTTSAEDQEWMMDAAKPSNKQSNNQTNDQSISQSIVSHEWATVIQSFQTELVELDRTINQSADQAANQSIKQLPSLRILGSMINQLPFESTINQSIEQSTNVNSFLQNLGSFYQSIDQFPLSVHHTLFGQILNHLIAALTRLPSQLLLARAASLHGDLSIDQSINQTTSWATKYCVWSLLDRLIEKYHQSLNQSTNQDWQAINLSNVYRVCSSIYPSTISLLNKYGDITGTINPSIERVRQHVQSYYLSLSQSINQTNKYYSLLCTNVYPLIEVIILTQTEQDHIDYNQEINPATNQPSANQSSSRHKRLIVQSASKLTSFPILIDEKPFYIGDIPIFAINQLADSHPDLNKTALITQSSEWIKQLINIVQNKVALFDQSITRMIVPFVIQSLILICRQRSDITQSIILPALLEFYHALARSINHSTNQSDQNLLELYGKRPINQLMYLMRNGLLVFYRLPSCSQWWDQLYPILTTQSNSLVAMNTVDFTKDRKKMMLIQSANQTNHQTSSQQTAAQIQQPTSQSIITELREVIDISSPGAIELFKVLVSLSNVQSTNLVLSSMEHLSPDVVKQSNSQSISRSMFFIQTIAALQSAHNSANQSNNQSENQLSNQIEPTSQSIVPIKTSQMSGPVPDLTINDLTADQSKTLARSSYVRMLSTLNEEQLINQSQQSLRATILAKLNVVINQSINQSIEHTIGIPNAYLTMDAQSIDQSINDQSIYPELEITSSMHQSADYQALLTHLLNDLTKRYSLSIRWLFQLLLIKPTTVHVVCLNERLEDRNEGYEVNEPMMSVEENQSVKRKFENIDEKDEQMEDSSSDSANMKKVKVEDIVVKKSEIEDDQAIKKAEDEQAIKQAEDQSVNPSINPAINLINSPFVSSEFFKGLNSYLSINGSIEYQQTVAYVLSALESTILNQTSNQPENQYINQTAPPSLIAQFLLDLPVLPPIIWSSLSRYLTEQSTFSIGLLAVRALLLFRPPAAQLACQLLLETIEYTTEQSADQSINRNRCMQLAVNIVRRERQRAAAIKQTIKQLEKSDDVEMKESDDQSNNQQIDQKFECTPEIIQFALQQSEQIIHESFLADLPAINVNIVVPPEPVYDDIQLATEPKPDNPAVIQPVNPVIDPSTGLPINPQSVNPSDAYHKADFESARDEARVREIQTRLADAARKKKEFEKLTLRRALLMKEKEQLERASAERESARSIRIKHHLSLFFALLSVHPTLQMFSHLFKIYRGSSESARRFIHQFLPEFAANVGPTPPLLAAMRAEHVGAEPAVLHILQLLCANTAEASKHSDRAFVNAAITPHSPVAQLCWQLYTMRHGDARFIVPIAPILTADQVRKSLHRLVTLPGVHLKVAIQRILKPNVTINAKGSKLQALGISSQQITPADLVVHIHRIDSQRKAAIERAQAELQAEMPFVAAPVKTEDGSISGPPPKELNEEEVGYPLDDNVWLKSLIGACMQCYSHLDLYPPPVFAHILNTLKEDRPIARLFMRTMIQSLQLYPAMAPFVLETAVQVTRSTNQIIEQAIIFDGLVKLLSMTLPAAVGAMAAMPDQTVNAILGNFEPGAPPPVPKKGTKNLPQQQMVSAFIQFAHAQPAKIRPSLRERIFGRNHPALLQAMQAPVQAPAPPMQQQRPGPPPPQHNQPQPGPGGWTHTTVKQQVPQPPQVHPSRLANQPQPHVQPGGWSTTRVGPK